jgi:1,4-dihydroxy-2-naphthoate polyprenyltransferase
MLALLPVAISIHYTNEYADYKTDALTKRTIFSGGSGALERVLLNRRYVLLASVFTLILGLGFALIGSLPTVALIILILGALAGWMYSLPPLKLAWHGLGELTNALLGGSLLMFYGYSLQTGFVDNFIVLVSIPFTALVFVNLLAVTWSDRDADARVGKYTLATRWSTRNLRLLYVSLVIFALLSWFLLTGSLLPLLLWLVALPVIPLLAWGVLTYTRLHSPHPTVFAMVSMLLAQMFVWGCICLIELI